MNTTFLMRASFLLRLLLLLGLGVVGAEVGAQQTPWMGLVGSTTATTTKGAGEIQTKAPCTNDAGDISQIIVDQLSNTSLPQGGSLPFSAFDNVRDTIFLCRGDGITLDLDSGSIDVSGDPNPLTEPGVAWGAYDCPPTISGTTLGDLESDSCNNINSGGPLQQGSLLFFNPVDFEGGNFDLAVENSVDYDIPLIFADQSGRRQPKVLYLAPVTVDGIDNDPFSNEEGYVIETNPAPAPDEGQTCTNARIDQALAIGWLNEIEVVNDFQSSSDCSGSFTLQGGVSELRGTGGYIITITNQTTGAEAVTDLPGESYMSGDVVTYSVPEPGDYLIEIEDGISCSGSTVINHPVGACAGAEPPAADPVNLSVSINPVTCAGDDDGALNIGVTGGVPPYTVTYTRTNPTPQVTNSGTITTDGGTFRFDGLRAGFYDLTVTDADGDQATSNGIRIEEGNPFTADIEIAPGGQCNASNQATLVAVVNVDGNRLTDPAAEGYEIAWSTGETTDTITVTPNRQYTLTVTNTNSGCIASESTTPAQPGSLLIDIDRSDTDPATCSGSEDGTINIQATGGTKPTDGYRFVWSDGVEQTGDDATRTSLNPGDYTVEVFDANGCTDSRTFTVAAEKTLVLTLDSTNVTCFGDEDGTISVSASTEGAGADLPYSVTVQDTLGNEVRATTTLPGNGATPEVFSNFGPGTYVVILQDDDPEMCETRDTVTIIEPELLEITNVATQDVTCPDGAGSATVNVTGGTAPYIYRFVNDSIRAPSDTTTVFDSTTVTFDSTTIDSITMMSLDTIGELQADTNYYVIVTDANGCVDTMTFQIASPPQAFVNPIVTDFISCPGDSDGQLTVLADPPPGDSITITGYTWYRLGPDGGLGEEIDIGRTTSADLTVGGYVVEVATSNECTSFGFGQVASPGLVQLDSAVVIDPSCRSDENGSIFLYPSGGTPYEDGSYDVFFNGSDTPVRDSIFNGLAAGTYNVRISDANGCQPALDTTFTIEEPEGIIGEFTVIEDVSCPSDEVMDGSATFVASLSDGTPATFDFIWSTGDTIRGVTSSTQTGLARGPITVTVTDGICPQVFTDTIGSPDDFAFETDVTDASCNGVNDGSATVTVTGGTPGYTFDWVDRTESSGELDSLAAGLYQLVVTDANGCEADTVAVVVNQPDPLTLSIDQDLTTPLVTCAGDEDGVLAVFVSSINNNPLADNPYRWSDNVEDNDDEVARNLAPGTYTVSVTDVQGCQDSLTYTIVEPQPIVFAVEDIAAPLCFGETTSILIDTVLGGQASGPEDYTFTLNNDGFLIPVDQPGTAFAGQTIVTVFDSVGCSVEDTFDIQQPEEILIDLPERIIVELGDSLQQLNPVVTPTNGNYTYEWTPPVQLSNDSIRSPFINPIFDQEYTFTVTDENGCQAIDDILVLVDANRNIYIPNAFSPDQDGRNDDFRIYACRGVVGINSVAIYNRWGGLVHEDSNIAADCLAGTLLWNGLSNGDEPMGSGVYVYVVQVTFLDGVQLTYRGDIAIVR